MKTEEMFYQHWYFEVWAASVFMSVSDLHFSCSGPCRFQIWVAASVGFPGDLQMFVCDIHMPCLFVSLSLRAHSSPHWHDWQYCTSTWTNVVSTKVDLACCNSLGFKQFIFWKWMLRSSCDPKASKRPSPGFWQQSGINIKADFLWK